MDARQKDKRKYGWKEYICPYFGAYAFHYKVPFSPPTAMKNWFKFIYSVFFLADFLILFLPVLDDTKQHFGSLHHKKNKTFSSKSCILLGTYYI